MYKIGHPGEHSAAPPLIIPPISRENISESEQKMEGTEFSHQYLTLCIITSLGTVITLIFLWPSCFLHLWKIDY